MATPPEGISPEEIADMTDEQVLDMDYFMNEDDFKDDEVGSEGFYIF